MKKILTKSLLRFSAAGAGAGAQKWESSFYTRKGDDRFVVEVDKGVKRD